MKKIILISAIRSDLGICTISPLLRKDGHEVKLLFVPELLKDCHEPLTGKVTAKICEFIASADIIGVNSFSENYHKTAGLVSRIKKSTKAPVIWGGIHATIRPFDCLKYADAVCIGEGEKAMQEAVVRLEKKEWLEGIKNLMLHNGENNPEKIQLHPLVDLNSLAPLDYNLSFQYLVQNNRIRNIREDDFRGLFYSFSSRGCPFRCTYCCGHVMLDVYAKENFCRQRKLENIIRELKSIKARFPSCRRIWFNEADFLSGKSQGQIEDFSRAYKAEIDIPFSIWSHPAAISDEKIKALRDAGFRGISIGTVNASDRIQRQIYKRNADASLYLEKSNILHKYGISVEYDVILCNPYEHDDEIINTIRLLTCLPKSYKLVLNSLTYFPKTELYEAALKDGIIQEGWAISSYTKAAYQVWKFKSRSAYLNIVLSLMRGQAKKAHILGVNYYGILPEPLLLFLIKKPVINFFEHLPFSAFIYRSIACLVMAGNMIRERVLRK